MYVESVLQSHQISPERLRPITRADYERMVAEGFFADERVELLCGALVTMSPQGPLHAGVVTRLRELLVQVLPPSVLVREHSPFAATDLSEPEPDLAAVPRKDYLEEHPTMAHLLVEVSDSSQKKDRLKARVYARSGVPEYWIVDLPAGVLEVYSDPRSGDYATKRTFKRGESITLQAFPVVTISVSDVLPAPA